MNTEVCGSWAATRDVAIAYQQSKADWEYIIVVHASTFHLNVLALQTLVYRPDPTDLHLSACAAVCPLAICVKWGVIISNCIEEIKVKFNIIEKCKKVKFL